ncbi:MAG: trypsin-like peptidase domain-containing protein [Bdellovibrionales bacterium]|nr:trypsin-like peptidase domain-containing protein [Bdellovibrionales bacterium]
MGFEDVDTTRMSYLLQIKTQLGTVVKELHLSSFPVKIGRAAGSTIVLTDQSVSANHGEVDWRDGKLVYTDLDSVNGTTCSGRRVKSFTIEGEATLQIADYRLHFIPELDELLEKTQSIVLPRAGFSWSRWFPAGVGFAVIAFIFGIGATFNWFGFSGSLDLSSPHSIQQLKKGIYEVVIDKIEDASIVYKDKAAFDLIPFKTKRDKYIGIGTAFSVKSGEFITAAHVLTVDFGKLPQKYYLRDDEGKTHPIKEILRYSTRLDLAVFSLETSPAKPLTLKLAPKYQEGETVYTVGNAQGEGISVRSGNIASFTPETESGMWKFIRFSAPASPGNSGGPLLNAAGAVTGVITMKNGSENLNYALPIEMLGKLNPKRAHFFAKSAEHESNQQLLETDEFYVDLPKTIHSLASAYSDGSFEKTVERRKRFESKFESNLFPKEKRFSQYLRSQDYRAMISEVDIGTNGTWATKEQKISSFQVSGDRKLYFGVFGDSVMHFNLEKRTDQTLANFISNPKEIMDTVITTVKWGRTVGTAKAEILSYGEPQEKEVWKDPYGRSWMLFTWRTQFDRQVHSLNCLPYPSGLDCLWSYEGSSLERFRKYYWKVEAPRYLFSYEGRVEDWIAFLTDPALSSYRPDFFKDVSVKSLAKKIEFFSPQGYQTEFNFEKLGEQSYLSVALGFPVQGPSSLQIHRLTFMPDANKPERQTVSMAFEPLPEHPAEYKATWAQMDPSRAPFNGVLIPQDSNQKSMFVRPVSKLGRSPSSESGASSPQTKLLFTCMSSMAESKTNFLRQCRGFVERTKLHY